MKTYENGIYRELTPEELEGMEAQAREQELQYWLTTPYDEAVNAQIRKRYSVSQEFAILRQRDQKPEEYAAYFGYCEECKNYVKEKMEEASSE
jgi:hypothetical protein